jgi:SAM-dependent methyltransferase
MNTIAPSPSEYLLGAEEFERSRLLLQAEIHRPQAEGLLGRLNVPAGGRALDLGCGPLGVLDLLSAAVGPSGRAIGIDNEPKMVAHARATIAERALTNVELALGEGSHTGLPTGSFDLAHERLVLVNHSAPEDVVAEMARVVRPGGWVALQEVDCELWRCEPRHDAWDELHSAFVETFAAAGRDPGVGRRLPALLREAELTDVAFDIHAYHWGPGHPYQTLLLHFTGILRERILKAGLLTADRLEGLEAELERHLARPETFVIHALFFQAWARR